VTVVGISGAAGRMGRLVASAIDAEPDLELHGLFDPAGGEILGRSIEKDGNVLEGAEVVVEFTRPDVVLENLAVWKDMGCHVVVGTSGFDEKRIAEVAAIWSSGPLNCLIVPNFSIGAAVMMRLAEIAAPHFDAAEIIELHHDHKVDAPSGTALETASRIAAAKPDQIRAVEAKELLRGARGAEAAGVSMHAVRLPGFVAHQQVILGGQGERLTISHDTVERSSFMPGVLIGVRSVANLTDPVTIGLESLLGL